MTPQLTIDDLAAEHPEAVGRIVARIQTFVKSQPERRQLDLELSAMPTVIDHNGPPTIRVTFEATGDVLEILAAEVGIHFVDDAVLYLPAGDHS